ncbi:MAG: hypothetical protein CBE17_01690 [Gammaproteobacteria bacterium TMED257]|nr:MAG: hypothetical protein CBE17_01690 [Gammaproteobacteria bacterium TMED257]
MTENKIFIERNSPSDEEFFIHQIYVSNGEFVKKDTLLAEVEGAKAVFEIYSDEEGYFYTDFKNGDYVDISDAFALISDKEISKDKQTTEAEELLDYKLLNLSKPAIKFVQDNKIDLESNMNDLSKLELITVDDLKKLINSSPKKERFEIKIKKENLKSWKELNSKEGKEPIFVIGGGYGAYQVLELIIDSGEYYLEGYFDDSKNTKLDLLGIERLGNTDKEIIIKALEKYKVKNLIVAISNNPKLRSKFENLGKKDINLVTLIHSSAIIGNNVQIGEGSIVFGGVHIGPDSEIGKMSFISSNSTIEHHNLIGKAFCCGPNFSSSGIVEIGDFVRTGINVGVEPFLKIGKDVVLASGVIVTKNIEDNEIVKFNK